MILRAFFFRRPATLESAAICSLPRGGGLGRGHSPRMAVTFPNTLTAQIQALRLVALSLTLSHGREDGWLLRLGVLQKNGCAGCFFAFQTTCINGCKSKLLFKPPATAKSAAICSPPRGGGLGRGHPPNFGNLSQHPNRLNTSLAACCPLSNSLPRGERTGWLLGLRVMQGKQVVQAAFCFSDDLQSTPAYSSCFSNRLQPQKLPQSAPSPVGEGWGEGILQIAAIFPNPLTAQIQALRLVALSLALCHGERGRGICWS